jgi:DNA-binding MarR family transcriptional regulator
VQAAGRVRPKDLADHLGLSRAAVTQQVQSLTEAGELTAETDPNDRRSVFLEVTPAGQNRLRALTERGLQRWTLFTADWTRDEIQTLADLLLKLEQSIAAAVRGEPPVIAAPWSRTPPGQAPSGRTPSGRTPPGQAPSDSQGSPPTEESR